MSPRIQDEPLSEKSRETSHNQLDPSCFSLLSPLFISSQRLTHLEVPTPTTEKMADAQDQEEKLERKTTTMEQRPADDNSSSRSKSEGSISEGSPTPKTAAPVGFVAPNGGYKAWSAVAGGFLCQFASFGFLNVSVHLKFKPL
jgi:hypothetical protein